ncbi:MAG: aminotransferase class V-fold PLP-dependent enzyme [Spirochaetota bacterium]
MLAVDPFQGDVTARFKSIHFIVDAISAFLCDRVDMGAMGIDLLITSSQKAMGLAPGLSVVILSPRALEAAAAIKPRCHYFAFSRYLSDGKRGQTPFTPAVGTILQLRARLDRIVGQGAAVQVARCGALAKRFRGVIAGLPFRLFPDRPSNALTALNPTDGVSAYEVYSRLRREHRLVVTPNGGKLRDSVFRVGHMGNLDEADMDEVARALGEVSR